MFCSQCGTENPDGELVCSKCGATLVKDEGKGINKPDMPMKWYKFLAFFALWAGAFINLAYGFRYLGENAFGNSFASELIFEAYPKMKGVMVVCGLATIATAALNVWTAINLIKYKKAAPKLVVLNYVAGAVVNIYYLVATASIVAPELVAESNIILTATFSVILAIVFSIINIVYFKKRKHLFEN